MFEVFLGCLFIWLINLRIPPSFQNFTRKSVDYLNRRKIVCLALNGHIWSLYYLNSHSTFLISCMKSMTHNHDVINQQFATSDQKLNMLLFSKPDEWILNWMFPWSFWDKSTGYGVFDISQNLIRCQEISIRSKMEYVIFSGAYKWKITKLSLKWVKT